MSLITDFEVLRKNTFDAFEDNRRAVKACVDNGANDIALVRLMQAECITNFACTIGLITIDEQQDDDILTENELIRSYGDRSWVNSDSMPYVDEDMGI